MWLASALLLLIRLQLRKRSDVSGVVLTFA